MSHVGDPTRRDFAPLFHGPISWFSEWPDLNVPRSGALVYTIWRRDGAFMYVGMAGRNPTPSIKGKGPFGRLNSHASGARSGDQFCIYICDRFVLPSLGNRLRDIADGTISLDRETRAYIRSELGYRWQPCGSASDALTLERAIQRGEAGQSCRPLCNGVRA